MWGDLEPEWEKDEREQASPFRNHGHPHLGIPGTHVFGGIRSMVGDARCGSKDAQMKMAAAGRCWRSASPHSPDSLVWVANPLTLG